MGLAAFDSTQGTLSLGFTYIREKTQIGLDPDYLPAWRLPEDEIEQYSILSVIGGSGSISFINRSISIGVGAFYRGNKSDLGRTIHGFELNPSLGMKFIDQIAFVNGVFDALNYQEERAYEGGIRWGLLEPSAFQLPWVQCSSLIGRGIYRSAGGVEVDWSVDLPEEERADLSTVAAGLDFPLSCQLSLRGGYQWRFIEENGLEKIKPSYGMGLSIDNINVSLNYDVQLILNENQMDHQHLIGLRIRLAPWKFKQMKRQ